MLLQANLLLEIDSSPADDSGTPSKRVILQFCLQGTQTRASVRTKKLLLRNNSTLFSPAAVQMSREIFAHSQKKSED